MNTMIEAIRVILAFFSLLFSLRPAVLTWYGSEGDGYLGARHGASWHGDTCGLPERVDLAGFGTAAPRGIPYCSRVLVCIRICVVVTVVDRQRDDRLFGLDHFDLWPAPAERLGVIWPGVVEGWVVVLP
jgi:hypothetical protein